MATPHPHLRSPRFSEVTGAVARPRDSAWERILFRAPELSNARLIFDPQPFRAHEFAPVRSAKGRDRR